jgi:hypothetical protein
MRNLLEIMRREQESGLQARSLVFNNLRTFLFRLTSLFNIYSTSKYHKGALQMMLRPTGQRIIFALHSPVV